MLRMLLNEYRWTHTHRHTHTPTKHEQTQRTHLHCAPLFKVNLTGAHGKRRSSAQSEACGLAADVAHQQGVAAVQLGGADAHVDGT